MNYKKLEEVLNDKCHKKKRTNAFVARRPSSTRTKAQNTAWNALITYGK